MAIVILLMFLCGCNFPTTGATVSANPTPSEAIVSATPTPSETIVSATPTPSETIVSATPTLTVTIVSATPTQAKIANLDFCQLTDLDICIESFSLTANNELHMVLVVNQNNSETLEYLIFFDETRCDCVPIAGFADKYFCQKLPLRLNEDVRIKVFSTASAVPLAEGIVYLDNAQFLEPTPKATHCGPPAGWVVYIVRAGDNLFRLAKNTQTTVARIKRANCLVGNTINVGQELYLPFIPVRPPPDPYTP